jgi:hypothetical protein
MPIYVKSKLSKNLGAYFFQNLLTLWGGDSVDNYTFKTRQTVSFSRDLE